MRPSLETRVAFDALMVTVVAPELKRLGYRKRGLRWKRSRDDIEASISVPRASRALDEVLFAFEFEVCAAGVRLSGRVGALLPEPGDVWWRVHTGVLSRVSAPLLEPQLVEHEIADAVARLGNTLELLASAALLRSFAEQNDGAVQLGLLELSEPGSRSA